LNLIIISFSLRELHLFFNFTRLIFLHLFTFVSFREILIVRQVIRFLPSKCYLRLFINICVGGIRVYECALHISVMYLNPCKFICARDISSLYAVIRRQFLGPLQWRRALHCDGDARRWHVSEFSPHRKERHRLLIIVNGFINNWSCRSTRRRRVNIARRVVL